MPYPDFRELSVANVGSNLRPRAATRDLRASVIVMLVQLSQSLLSLLLLLYSRMLRCCG